MPTPTATESAGPPRQQRWIPLSLRMFLALMALLFVGSSLWIGVPTYRQQVAINELERLGGKVHVEVGGPDWLYAWIGDRGMVVFEYVPSVDLSKTEITDDSLRFLSRLARLEKLELYRTNVTDAGLRRIATLTELKVLGLDETNITDGGVASLNRCTKLAHLHLRGTRITDAGIQSLKGLPSLTRLFLGQTAVSDRGLADVPSLARLRLVELLDTSVTDAGIKQLSATRPDLCIQWDLGFVGTPTLESGGGIF